MIDRAKMTAQLVLHEGLRLRPYKDTVGKTTIGVGRNLDDRGITEQEAYYLLENDIGQCISQLNNNLFWFKDLDEVRARVLVDMCFNLGIGRLLKFRRTLASIEAGNYQTAAGEMLQSAWATQVGQRAKRLSRMMRTGIDP